MGGGDLGVRGLVSRSHHGCWWSIVLWRRSVNHLLAVPCTLESLQLLVGVLVRSLGRETTVSEALRVHWASHLERCRRTVGRKAVGTEWGRLRGFFSCWLYHKPF